MSHAKHPLDKQLRKEIEKEVKKGQKQLSSAGALPENPSLTAPKRKSPPSHAPFTAEALVEEIKLKKKKQNAKHSKRSSPGTVDHRESPPASIHGETPRIEKAKVSQSKFRGKLLTKKLEKRVSSTRRNNKP